MRQVAPSTLGAAMVSDGKTGNDVQPELGLGLELHRAKYVSLSSGAQNKAGVTREGRNLTHLARDGV